MKNKTQNHIERAHAFASPSDYGRWGSCAGALTLQKKLDEKGLLPEDSSSPAAERGTELHELAEQAILGHDVEVPEEIEAYIDYCKSMVGDTQVEAKVPLIYSPEETGTVDFACVDGEVLKIVDLKTGRFPVPAKDNRPLLIYALGLVTSEIKEIHMTIFQFGTPDTWVIDIFKAREIAYTIKRQAEAALDDSITTLSPSDKACKWCRCRAYCTAHTGEFFDIIEEGSNSGDLKKLTDDTLVNILANKKKIQNFLDSVETVLYDRSIAGEAINGVTVKQGRKANKRWRKNIDPVEEMIKSGMHLDQVVKTTPITPTQALKLGSISEDLYEQPEGKPVIVANNPHELIQQFDKI